MFSVKPYLLLVVLLGTGLLIYGLTFLSVKAAPLPDNRSSELLMMLVETITAVVAILAAVTGGLYYFLKSRLDNPSAPDRHTDRLVVKM